MNKYTYQYGCINGSYQMTLNIYEDGALFYQTKNNNKIKQLLNYMKHSEDGKKYGIQASVKKYLERIG